jgi:glycosyltransferase involved in cell wall biosynthesis
MGRRALIRRSENKMRDDNPLVSIVLPTYNGSRYIAQSINSCLDQSYKNIELIIVDDCSIDNTPKIVASYTDKRIKYIRHKINKGLPAALNTGFASSNGEYLTWTSDDNFYDKEAVSVLAGYLKKEKCDYVYADFYLFRDEDAQNAKIIKLPEADQLKNRNVVGPCFMYTKKVKETIGGYDPITSLAEDYDYWIRISKTFSLRRIDVPLYYYRLHGHALSSGRHCETGIAAALVRIKNKVCDAESSVKLITDAIAKSYPGSLKINRVLVKLLLSKKIRAKLRAFEEGTVNYETTRAELIGVIMPYKRPENKRNKSLQRGGCADDKDPADTAQ